MIRNFRLTAINSTPLREPHNRSLKDIYEIKMQYWEWSKQKKLENNCGNMRTQQSKNPTLAQVSLSDYARRI